MYVGSQYELAPFACAQETQVSRVQPGWLQTDENNQMQRFGDKFYGHFADANSLLHLRQKPELHGFDGEGPGPGSSGPLMMTAPTGRRRGRRRAVWTREIMILLAPSSSREVLVQVGFSCAILVFSQFVTVKVAES